jgi:hypothetical protein
MGRAALSRMVSATLLCVSSALGQIIEFETNGLKYQTLTRNGLTVMVAQLQAHVRDYSILQVAIANGSGRTYLVRPEDFVVTRDDGTEIVAVPARTLVNDLVDRAGRNDVIRLVTAYEATLYGNQKYRATNGYEARRQQALAEVGSTKIKAAAAASAIVFVQTKLAPGESTDGAVFYLVNGKNLGPGQLRVRAAGSIFEFPVM